MHSFRSIIQMDSVNVFARRSGKEIKYRSIQVQGIYLQAPIEVCGSALHDFRDVNPIIARDVLIAYATSDTKTQPSCTFLQLYLDDSRGFFPFPLCHRHQRTRPMGYPQIKRNG